MARLDRIPPTFPKKPDPKTGRYTVSYRNENEDPRKKRFTRDRKESLSLFNQWLAETFYGQMPIVNPNQADDKPISNISILRFVDEYTAYILSSVRDHDDPKGTGLLDRRTAQDYAKQMFHILEWHKKRFPDECRITPFNQLMHADQYEEMMKYFVNNKPKMVDKLRKQFWRFVKWARRKPRNHCLDFTEADVKKFKSPKSQKKKTLPTIDIIRTLLEHASLRMQTWIWMGIGLGFSQSDIARCYPADFLNARHNIPRGKTDQSRSALIPSMVKAYIQLYLNENPRPRNKLMFVTRNGNPIVWQRGLDEEIENESAEASSKKECWQQLLQQWDESGLSQAEFCRRQQLNVSTFTWWKWKLGQPDTPKQSNRGESNMIYRRTDSFTQEWRRLKEKAGLQEWKGTFYSFRHLAATIYTSRKDSNMLGILSMMGHAKLDMTAHYMRVPDEEIQKTVDWCIEMLDQSDPEAWCS